MDQNGTADGMPSRVESPKVTHMFGLFQVDSP